MIGKLTGKIDELSNTSVILDVNGVGYQVLLNENTLNKLSATGEGGTISLFIHTDVREDHIQLFGFLDPAELKIFKLLLTVSGIGPKAALGILNIASAGTIKNAIFQQDHNLLTQVPGIGKKTAERVCLELNNKIDNLEIKDEPVVQTNREVVDALVAMGYSVREAHQALKLLPPEITDEAEMIKLALKNMNK